MVGKKITHRVNVSPDGSAWHVKRYILFLRKKKKKKKKIEVVDTSTVNLTPRRLKGW